MHRIAINCVLALTCLALVACKKAATPAYSTFKSTATLSATPRFTLTPTPPSNSQQTQITSSRMTAAAGLTQAANRQATMTAGVMTATASAPTYDYVATDEALKVAVMTSTPPKTIETYPSPDGQYVVEVIRFDCIQIGSDNANAYEQLKLVRVKDGSEKVVMDQLQYCGGVGSYGLGGLFWSPDGRYFYFTGSKYGVPDGGLCEIFVRSMFRIDPGAGILEYTPGWGKITADHKTMIIPSEGEFVLWDLDAGEVGRIPYKIPDAYLTNYELAPDKESLVYIQTENCVDPHSKSYLVKLDLATLEQDLLLEADNPPLSGVSWENPDQLIIYKVGPSEWVYDLTTGKLTPKP
jgi:WD40-like Beta Propeller Repeat